MPTERRRTSRGADPDAVLGHPLQAGDPGLDQSREAIDQQAFQHRTMSDPEVAEGLGVHADTPTQPLTGDVLLTQTRHLPGTADALDRRKQPQGDKNARVRRRMSRLSFDSFDRGEQGRQVQLLDKAPHQTNAMIIRDKVVERNRSQFHLPAFCHAKPWKAARRSFRHRLFRKALEQVLDVMRCHRPTSKHEITMAILAEPIRRRCPKPTASERFSASQYITRTPVYGRTFIL